MSKIDLAQLRVELQGLQRHHALYKVLQRELTALGYWRKLPRGNPRAGFKAGWGNKSRLPSG